MKAVVIHHDLSARGGGEKVCVTVLELLHEMGFDISLVTISPPKIEEIKKAFGKDVSFVKEVHKLLPFRLRMFGIYQRMFTLIPSLRVEGDICLVTHGDVYPYLTSKIPTISYCYFPVVALIQKMYPSKYQHGFWRAYFEPYRMTVGLLMGFAMKRNVVVTISKFSYNAIKELFGVDSIIIPPPVDVETFSKAFSREKEEDLIISLGRYAPEKKHEYAIYVLSKLPKNVRLKVIGTLAPTAVTYYNYLKRYAEKLGVADRVELVHDIPLNELLDIMSRAKVLFHGYRGEHFGLAVAEAMAAGLIPVVWDYGGQSEFTPKEYQFHTLEEAPKAVMKALEASPSEREKVHKIAWNFSEEKFKKRFAFLIRSVLKMAK